MAKRNELVGLFLALFMFILLFPSLNQYCVDIREHENATDIEVTVGSILPIILIAFILVFAFLILYLTFRSLGA